MSEQVQGESSLLGILRDLGAQKILWFCAGLFIGAALAVGLHAVHFVPVAVAFGFLCFGFGIVIMEFFALRRQREEYARRDLENAARWLEIIKEIEKVKSEWDKRSAEFEADKETWEAQKAAWEADKEAWEEDKILWQAEKEVWEEKKAEWEAETGRIPGDESDE